MTARRRLIVLAIMVLSAALAAYLFRPLREAGGFHVPGRTEFASAQRLFAGALGGKDGAALADPAGSLGFEARPVAEPGWTGLAIAEPAGECAGRGVYLLRGGKSVPLAVTAPHRGADRLTGELASLLFTEHALAAAAWNSAPRRESDGCGGGDVTRTETHYFTAFSLAFAERHGGGRLVQLHGFDRAKRESEAGRTADIILSDGSEMPGEGLLDLGDCLSRRLAPLQVAVFPYDAPELGGLANRQGQALREAGFAGFAHIEIEAGLRRRLADDAQLRGRFAACLMEGLR